MTDQWWFPLAAIGALCACLGIAAAVVDFLRARLLQRDRDFAAGLVVVIFIAYVVLGIGYAFWTTSPHLGEEGDSPREFIR